MEGIEEKMSHYFSQKPSSSGKTTLIQTFQLGHHLKFQSQSGIFGWRKIDKGSELLLGAVEIPPTKSIKLLDLGCGYGFLGISLAKAFPEISVFLTDINELAVKLTRENCKLNNVQRNTRVRQGHLYEPIKQEKFDIIITNPPLMAGKKILKELIEESVKYLTANGSFLLVVPKKKGLISMQNMITETYSSYDVKSRGSGFWVLNGTKT